MTGVRTLREIGDLIVEDEGAAEIEDTKWYKRPLLGEQLIFLESFAPLKAKRFT